MPSLSFFLFVAACFFYTSSQLLKFLRYLQQETYIPKRFCKWFFRLQHLEVKGSLTLFFVAILTKFHAHYFYLLGALVLSLFCYFAKDPRKTGKIPLIMTARAKRIFFLACFFQLVLEILIASCDPFFFWPLQIILLQGAPFLLGVSVLALFFDERKRQRFFIAKAKLKLEKVNPYVIGITGSYGKTSTKNALGHILNCSLGATFSPKEGINTEMGITKEICGSLKSDHRFAAIEMAAYGIGSISRLCALTPPMAGIITTIGLAHLERFGSVDAICKAKSELAKAIPYEGILVVNGDDEKARVIALKYPKKTTLFFGFDNQKKDIDLWVEKYRFFPFGQEFSIRWQGNTYSIKTKLMGKTAIYNLAASLTMALALKAPIELAIGALANLRPVNNRLEVFKAKGVTYLKDAYNSNPKGFSDALDVLASCNALKKILITPGMIELSEKTKEAHEKVGRKAGQICDFAIIVGKKNRLSLTKGLLEGGMPTSSIFSVAKREEAFNMLKEILEPESAVLIENDLPDLYEDL